jgi:hypothetical protein
MLSKLWNWRNPQNRLYLHRMLNLFAALVPYIAVLVGMYVFHNAWLTILLYHIGIVLLLMYRRPEDLWSRMWKGARSLWLIPGILGCALATPIIYFMWPWFEVPDLNLSAWLVRYGLGGWPWVCLIPYFSIVHPVLEEIHWRRISPEKVEGLCWQDFLFAGYHVLVLFQIIRVPWLIFIFVVLVGSSFCWRWSTLRFKGYGLAIITHGVADAAVIVGVQFLLI